jgi:hypothetical protein
VKRSSLILGCFPKLKERYCGPFEILENIGTVAYMLALSTSMRVNNVFHVSVLNKCVLDSNHVIDWIVIQVETRGLSGGTSTHLGPKIQSDQEQIHRVGKGSMDLLRS